MTDLDKAREWAESLAAGPATDRAQATAKVIQSLPNAWVDVEKLREVVSKYEGNRYISEIVQDFADLLPVPKLPTLADMPPDERLSSDFMQARLDGSSFEFVISEPGLTESRIWAKNGTAYIVNNRQITPLPDLPKLEWPGSAPDDVAYATGGVLTTQDVVDECRAVRKERALPRPEDVPDPHPGEAWLVNTREGEQREALKAENSWYVKDGDDVEEWVEEALTPISRLVPESHTLPEGMRLADHAEHGRVVTSPRVDDDDDYKLFLLTEKARTGSGFAFAHESTLNFLGGEPDA